MGTFRVSDSVSEQVQLRLKTLCQRTPDDKSQSMLLRKIEDCSPKIALKIVTCSSPTEITAIDRELNIHEKLGSQKGIVPMGRLEAHSADYRVGVMPLYDGDLLELCRDQVYGPEDITHWFTDIGSSLKQLHDFGLIHSDLKLENILYRILDGKVEVALADFDLSDTKGSERHSEEEYCAPEVSRYWWSNKNESTGQQKWCKGKYFQASPTRDFPADVWGIGYMIRSCIDYIDPDMNDFLIRELIKPVTGSGRDPIERILNNLSQYTERETPDAPGNNFCRIRTDKDREMTRALLQLSRDAMAVNPAERPTLEEVLKDCK